MMGCCGCCSALRPRYKRLVDNIFPVNPEDGLVKSNMEKLTFYSLRSPEKLDRIGEYLYQRASKDINRKQHMEKIVPSLLFNMQSANGGKSVDHEATPSTPPVLAEAVLRELVSRASFGHIRAVLKPLLTHLDHHKLWVPNRFAIDTFRIVMISIQPQYSYTVVETLMSHLDQNLASSPKTRTSLAVVLSKIIAIAAGESVGPSALDIINNLLTHLKTSVSTQHESTPEETQYQEALINALGEFANHHPDYQKIEIMLFFY